MLTTLRPGSVVMDMSTIDPLLTDRLATAVTAKGSAFVDAPVGRLASHAARGESLFMVGATDDAFARVRPLLDAMGTTVHHCGAPGAGIRTKLVNNYLALLSCGFHAAALALSQRLGLSLENAGGRPRRRRPTGSSRSRGPRRCSGDTSRAYVDRAQDLA